MVVRAEFKTERKKEKIYKVGHHQSLWKHQWNNSVLSCAVMSRFDYRKIKPVKESTLYIQQIYCHMTNYSQGHNIVWLLFSKTMLDRSVLSLAFGSCSYKRLFLINWFNPFAIDKQHLKYSGP